MPVSFSLLLSLSRWALLSAMRGQLYGPLSVQAKPLKWAVKGLLILLIPHAEIENSFAAQLEQLEQMLQMLHCPLDVDIADTCCG